MLDKNDGIFIISWTKVDDSFLSAQFAIEDFTTWYRCDKNDKRGGFLLYIRENMSPHLLQCKSQYNIDCFFPLRSILEKESGF